MKYEVIPSLSSWNPWCLAGMVCQNRQPLDSVTQSNTILLILLPLSWGLLPKVTIINDLLVKHSTTHNRTQAIQVIVYDLESAVQDHNASAN